MLLETKYNWVQKGFIQMYGKEVHYCCLDSAPGSSGNPKPADWFLEVAE